MSGPRRVRVDLAQPFPAGARKLAFVDGLQILIVNAEGTLYAIENSCPHAGSSLFGGKLAGRSWRCPSHGLQIDLATGCVIGGIGPGAKVYKIEPVPGGAELTI